METWLFKFLAVIVIFLILLSIPFCFPEDEELREERLFRHTTLPVAVVPEPRIFIDQVKDAAIACLDSQPLRSYVVLGRRVYTRVWQSRRWGAIVNDRRPFTAGTAGRLVHYALPQIPPPVYLPQMPIIHSMSRPH